jgi:anti-sigma factor RsiW
MDCDVTPILSAYLDGELDAGDRLRVESHIETCGSCRATLDEFRSVGAAASGYTSASGPFDGRRALATVLARGRTPLWRRRVFVPAAALPVVAVLAATGTFMLARYVSAPTPSKPKPQVTGEILRFDRGRPPVIAVIPTVIDHEERP